MAWAVPLEMPYPRRRIAIRRAVLPAAVMMVIGVLVGPGAAGAATASAGAVWTPVHKAASSLAPEGSYGATSSSPCVGTDSSNCMLPFPNDYYTSADPTLPTGRRVDLPVAAVPPAAGKSPFNPAPWEDNDGFSPGSSLLTHVPGLSLTKSGIATISDMGASLQRSSPVVLLDTTTGQHWPTWSELDVTDHDAATQLLMIHPAQNLTEGDHYVVALRNLRDATGQPIPAQPTFASVAQQASLSISQYLADAPTSPLTHAPSPLTAAYKAHLSSDITTLARYGVSASSLYVAWDFTVDSMKNLTSPEVTMRDASFAALGDGVPTFLVTKVVNDPPGNPSLAREVTGTFDTPSYLNAVGGPDHATFNQNPSGIPIPLPNNVQSTTFNCEIPKVATSSRPGHVGIYGHGLFGSSSEVYASSVPQFSDTYDYVFCGTDWLGLSSDLTMAADAITNLSSFPELLDHLMQSVLDVEFLGRLVTSPRGFAGNSAFEEAGRPLLNTRSNLVYYGNSEGGIMGGEITALSTQISRSVLGVPGMDYDLLLNRSADFAPLAPALAASYPNRAVQQLGLDIVQMLWDRAETDGYAEQMTGGIPGALHHQVLLGEGLGDHQVANISTETEARTIGAAIHMPALRAGRSNESAPFFDLPALNAGSGGPALFIWDAGVPPAPLSDTPPAVGPDPHDTIPRSLPAFWRQMNTFFTTGAISDPCGSAACQAPTLKG